MIGRSTSRNSSLGALSPLRYLAAVAALALLAGIAPPAGAETTVPVQGVDYDDVLRPAPAAGDLTDGLDLEAKAVSVSSFVQPDEFVPRPGQRTRRYLIPMAPGQRYDRIVLEMDVTPSGWYGPDPAGLHSLFWLQRGSRWRSNLFGYGNLRGPLKNISVLTTNVDLRRGQTLRQTGDNLQLAMGAPHHLRYVYDARSRRTELVITRGNQLVSRLSGRTTGPVHTKEFGFFVELGFEKSHHGPEVPTDGWNYRNLRVAFER